MIGIAAVLLALQTTTSMVAIPAGTFRPLYGRAGDAPVRVEAFRLDRDPVTRGEFLAFVREHPEWRRRAVRPVFAEKGRYLADWAGDLDAGNGAALRQPVVAVSWFAARAYCASRDARLPSVMEWEYVAAASATRRDAARDAGFVQGLVSLYATRAGALRVVDGADTNAFGARGMHDLVSEWVDDFNSVIVSDDSRGIGGRDNGMFCATAALGAADPGNYPAFLRYALRAGLSGRSTLETLGFRCAA